MAPVCILKFRVVLTIEGVQKLVLSAGIISTNEACVGEYLSFYLQEFYFRRYRILCSFFLFTFRILAIYENQLKGYLPVYKGCLTVYLNGYGILVTPIYLQV